MIPESVLAQFHGEPLDWGRIDCVQFTSACRAWKTGKNPADGFRYYTEDDALALIDEAGSMEQMVSSVLGEAEGRERLNTASDGDTVLLSFPTTGPMMGAVTVGDAGSRFILVLVHPPEENVCLVRPLALEHAIRIWPCR